jgi:hypothetical protein
MACPVCYAPAADAAIRESMNLGIFVLLGVTGVVLTAFARFFLALARRAREAARLVEKPEH